jgi:plastocyanin
VKRRTYLATVGSSVTALSVALAGCGGAPGGSAEETEADDESGNGDGAGATPTRTDTGDEEMDETATEGEMDGSGTTAAGTAGGGSSEVEMVTDGEEYYFDPIGLFVEPGATVTWVNVEGAHSSVAYAESVDQAETTRIPEDAEAWSSDILNEADATFEHTLETPGTYDYFCGPHKSLEMVGRVVVGEPGGPAEEGQPPDGELPDSQTVVDQGSVSYDEFSG